MGINKTQEALNRALIDAISRKSLEDVKRAVRDGASLTAIEHQGHTPLIEAAREGDIEIFKFLAKDGFNVDQKDQGDMGMSLLTHAADMGCTDIVRYILRFNPDLYSEDNYSQTAIQKAAWFSYVDTLFVLLDHVEKDRKLEQIDFALYWIDEGCADNYKEAGDAARNYRENFLLVGEISELANPEPAIKF